MYFFYTQKCYLCRVDYNIIFITCDMSAAAEFEVKRSWINNRLPSALQTSTDGAVDIIFMDKSQGAMFTTSIY